MNNRNKNYRVMKFLEPVNKSDKAKGYVRLDMRGARGMIMITVENVGDTKTTSEVYLFKDKTDKIKIGTVNNRKGMIKKAISAGNNNAPIEDYNVLGIVKDEKIVLFAPLFGEVRPEEIRKLSLGDDTIDEPESQEEITLENNTLLNETNEANEQKEVIDVNSIKETYEIKKPRTKNETNRNISEHIKEEQVNQVIDNVKQNENINVELGNNNQEDTLQQNIYMEMPPEEDEDEKDLQESSVKEEKRKYKNPFEENLYQMLENYEPINPLSTDIKNISWWKIKYADNGIHRGFLPYFNQIISAYYPYPLSNKITTCQNLMKKHGYYIFGVCRENGEVTKLVYGVPGRFTREEQPYKGITGFKNWSYKNKNTPGDYGFWLAFLDAHNGASIQPPDFENDK